MESSSTGPAVTPLRNDPEYIRYLEQRIAALEARVPQTKVIAPQFLSRALAIWGHYAVAQLLIGLAITIVAVIFSFIFAGGLAALYGPIIESGVY